MARVLGVGGIFFKSPDPPKLYEWYHRWLGTSSDFQHGLSFLPQAIPPGGLTVFSAFKQNTSYFAPSPKDFMFNLMVDNLDEALAQVKEGGATVVGEIQREDYGSFGWFIDPDGNKVELWEPKPHASVGTAAT
jgi:catechol 2,3-dioxygenase-like lactoylglutathione lyase family enzyme